MEMIFSTFSYSLKDKPTNWNINKTCYNGLVYGFLIVYLESFRKKCWNVEIKDI